MLDDKKGREKNNNNKTKEQCWRMKSGVWVLLQI